MKCPHIKVCRYVCTVGLPYFSCRESGEKIDTGLVFAYIFELCRETGQLFPLVSGLYAVLSLLPTVSIFIFSNVSHIDLII